MNKPKRRCPHCRGTGLVDDPYEIGLRLRADRIDAGKTMEQVAKKIGISKMYVSHLERGVRNWSDEMVEKYRKALK